MRTIKIYYLTVRGDSASRSPKTYFFVQFRSVNINSTRTCMEVLYYRVLLMTVLFYNLFKVAKIAKQRVFLPLT